MDSAEEVQRERDSQKNRKLLDQYLADKSKKLLLKDKVAGERRYEFEVWTKDLPNEKRVMTIYFVVWDDGEVRMNKHTRRSQKFICVNGPLAGQRLTVEDAPKYVVYNCAVFNRGSRNKKIPRAVLVYCP